MDILNFKKALTGVMLLGLTSSVLAENTQQWGHRALKLQSSLDLEAPLANSTWVGTHNSFANPQDDSAVDYNQAYSLEGQLDKGVRELVFDVHLFWNGKVNAKEELYLCHNNKNNYCGDHITGRRKLSYALDDIKQWLNKDGNSSQVVLLKLEMSDHARRNINKVEKKILNSMGSYVYRPDATNSHGDLDGNTGCTALPVSTMTKKQVLDAGKNVIIFNTHSCISDGGFNDLAFYGDDNLQNANTTDKLDGWDATKHNTVMSRVKDAKTLLGILGDSGEAKMKPNNVAKWMRSGANILEMYGFDGGDTWGWGNFGPVQAENMVWSWALKEPNDYQGEEDCALINSSGKMNDRNCEEYKPFACYTASNEWIVTNASKHWYSGFETCKAEGGVFRVPVNLRELDALNAKIRNTKGAGTNVWVNYSDTLMEGQWISNPTWAEYYGRYWKKFSSIGGNRGASFDDFDLLKLDLYRNKRKVTKVRMSAGNRVDKIGFEYDDGHKVSHGGNGFDRSLDLNDPNEYIKLAVVCSKSYNGSNRIFYVRLTTNKNKALEGGRREGSCKNFNAPNGYEVFAMHGHAGNELDALGFYYRRVN